MHSKSRDTFKNKSLRDFPEKYKVAFYSCTVFVRSAKFMPISVTSITLNCSYHLLKLTPTPNLKKCQGRIHFRKAHSTITSN